jgi:cytochrome c556
MPPESIHHVKRYLRKILCLGLVIVAGTSARQLLAEPPGVPKLSAIVPAEDLATQLQAYVKELDASLADEATYKSSAAKVKRIANTIAALAFSLGKHDTTTDMTPKTAGIGVAARRLAKAPDFAAAKQGLAALHEACEQATAVATEAVAAKIASLGQIMKEAEVLNSRLRNSLRRFDARRLADNARAAAALAAIAQASVYDTHEVKDPGQLPDWYRLASEMRDAAGQLNATIRAKDKPGATAALTRLDNSCKACHQIFAPME